jgi:hypothetical protein
VTPVNDQQYPARQKRRAGQTKGGTHMNDTDVTSRLEARKIAWRISLILSGGSAPRIATVRANAAPVAAWLMQATSAADLSARMAAAQFWIDTALGLAEAGIDMNANGRDTQRAIAETYDWLTGGRDAWTAVSGCDHPGLPCPDTCPCPCETCCPRFGPDDELTPILAGRQLFIIRCLLLRATEQHTPATLRPGITAAELVTGALDYARTSPEVTEEEINAVLRVIFNGDPRGEESTDAGYPMGRRAGKPGDPIRVAGGAQGDSPAPGGAGPGEDTPGVPSAGQGQAPAPERGAP